MGRKNKKNYYSPTPYQVYRNSTKAANAKPGDYNEEEPPCVYDDYYYSQLEKENRRNVTKPARPAPPINVKKEPKIKNTNSKVHRSVYDEIAEKHKNNPQKRYMPTADEVKTPQKSAKNHHDEDIKVYTPKEKQQESSAEIFSNSNHRKEEFIPLQSFENPNVSVHKENKNTGIWITVIIALLVLCLSVGGMYAYLNGFLDGLLSIF